MVEVDNTGINNTKKAGIVDNVANSTCSVANTSNSNNSALELTLRASGKINLYLNVKKGYREDGYHEIKSIMQSIGLWDELHFMVSKRNKNSSERKENKKPDEGLNKEPDKSYGKVQNISYHCEGKNQDIKPHDKSDIKSKLTNQSINQDRSNQDISRSIADISQSMVKNKSNNLREENGIYITSNNVDIPLDEKNLVHKAALLVLERFGLLGSYEVNINITKHIPVCAGLGGGSADAAATIVALDKLFNLNIRVEEVLYLASQVGADVPFCIGGGTALAEGKGEKVSKLPDLPFYWIVLAYNGKKFLSRDVYEKFDIVGKEKETIHKKLVNDILEKRFEEFFKYLENSLEEVVVREDEKVKLLKEKALLSGALFAQMTGSGPTVFAVCKDLKEALNVCESLKKLANGVFLTHTVSKSLEFV